MTEPYSIAIAVSGGIDSMTAAALLKADGHRVVGIHFTTGYGPGGRRARSPLPPAVGPRLGEQLGIAVETIDLADAFQAEVVDYFVRAYARGRTPNPCVVCNEKIKFGLLWDAARRLGATKLATGHYVRLKQDAGGRYRLYRGIDPAKDQSYFLARLDQRALSGACFPLGGMTKAQVRTVAAERGLAPVVSAESQDVCFIGPGGYTRFLNAEAGLTPAPGPIVDAGGRTVGQHQGLHRFTVGQRRGIDCPASRPYYVVAIEPEENRLVVGFRESLAATGCRVSDIRWIQAPPHGPVAVEAQIRYRSPPVPAKLIPHEKTGALLRFRTPVSAVTPGQAAVFYAGNEVLGGGWIQGALSEG
jgi:tRNA-uridine 2-sulfurtransferase